MDAASWLSGKPILEPGDPALAGARCAVHGDVPATFTCSRCGSYGCAECTFPVADGAPPLCMSCGRPVPWEDRRRLGWWKAFWETTKMASFRPSDFYELPASEGMAPAVGYGTLAYALGLVLLIVEIAVACLIAGLCTLPFQKEIGIGLLAYGAVFLVMVPFAIIQYAPWGLIACLVGGLISHGVLALFRQTKQPMEGSIRAVSYANAVYFWAWVPCVGLFVQYFWVPWIEAVGLSKLHGAPMGPALVATYGYRLLIVGAIVVLYLTFFGVMIASMAPGLR